MKFSDQDKQQIQTLSDSIQVQLPTLLAVIETESNGVPGKIIAGKLEPLIRYEGHYFDKLCNPSVRDAARKAGVSSPIAGKVKNPSDQVDVWALVRKAAQYDKDAAYQACSYGVGQVMGAHYKKLGYASVMDLVNDARMGLIGQVRLMTKFIKLFGLDDELRNLDWSGFARGYNGPNYIKNDYANKLAKAYVENGGTSSIDPTRANSLRIGSKGAAVRDIQKLLNTAGFTINVDGDFGKTTQQAVRAFQQRNGITVDGVVGPETQQALAGVREVNPTETTIQPLMNVSEVKQGLTTAVSVPVALETVKKPLQSVVDQLGPYSMFSDVVTYAQYGLGALALLGIIGGVAYAGYGYWKSKKTHYGTKSEDTYVPAVSTDLIAPGE
jgi:hypothetical protein